jgi:hypothetical protein
MANARRWLRKHPVLAYLGCVALFMAVAIPLESIRGSIQWGLIIGISIITIPAGIVAGRRRQRSFKQRS